MEDQRDQHTWRTSSSCSDDSGAGEGEGGYGNLAEDDVNNLDVEAAANISSKANSKSNANSLSRNRNGKAASGAASDGSSNEGSELGRHDNGWHPMVKAVATAAAVGVGAVLFTFAAF